MSEDKKNLSSVDFAALANIIKSDLVNNGVDIDQESLLSPASIFKQFMVFTFENVRNVLTNINRNNNLLETRSVPVLASHLVQTSDKPMFATPSKININVAIPIADILALGKMINETTTEFIYANKNTVVIDDKIFVITKDKYFIRLHDVNGDYKSTVLYKNDLGLSKTIMSQIIKLSNMPDLVVFEAEFEQVTTEVIEKNFVNDQVDEFIFTTKFIIHDFKLEYRDNESSDWIEIKHQLYPTRGIDNTIEYSFRSDNSIRVSHKYSVGGFKPKKGGTLRGTFKTTSGENVDFIGDAIPADKFPTNLSVMYMSTDESAVYRSLGGRAATSNADLMRQTVIMNKSTRRRIDTEGDMNSWLSQYEGSSIFKPRLNVNNIINRTFYIYTMLSLKQTVSTNDTYTFTIPTNTGDVLVDLNDLPKRTKETKDIYSIDPSMLIESMQTYQSSTFDIKVGAEYDPDNEKDGKFFYITPFIHSLSMKENKIRSFMDSQYGTPYETFSEFDSEDSKINTRFVNSFLRVYDMMKDEKTRDTYLLTRLRADNPDIKLTADNFKVKLILQDINKSNVEIEGVIDSFNAEDNTYDIKFNYTTDRHVFYDEFDINVKGSNKTIPIHQKSAKMEVYIKPENDFILVTRYVSDMNMFIDVTDKLFLQHNIEYTGRLNLVMCPLVSKKFYMIKNNVKIIYNELENVFKFIASYMYEPENAYASTRHSLYDLQETLYRSAIKFVKTYGHSYFLNVAGTDNTPLTNLQVKPHLYISKIDADYDTNIISNIMNNEFMNWDFVAEDLHMSSIVSSILLNSQNFISALQFISFDNGYPANFHKIENNGRVEKNDDVPEVLSIEPIYNERLGRYEYNVTYDTL